MVYPLRWIQQTFPTRERATELLRPELEENVLTPRDFQLATHFLPGPGMYWPTVYVVGLSVAVYGFGTRIARPRWTWLRLGLAGIAASAIGSTYGNLRILFAHHRFANSLEDPQAFLTALNHVDTRLGGPGNIAPDFTPITINSPPKRNPEDISHSQDADSVREEGWVQEPAHTEVAASKPNPATQPNPTTHRSKWEEIRVANSRGASQSSWDAVRQRHERSRLPESSPSSSGTGEADARAAAQAEFDALLEAERRRQQSQDGREFT